MDKNSPHFYHPTPQFRREEYMILNGEWDFALDEEPRCENYTSRILVPFCPESTLSGIERAVLPKHYMHYRRYITLTDTEDGRRTLLHIGAADQVCKVYLNGTEVGAHEGGYTPFTIDITDAVYSGENEIRVEARDRLDKKYPHGKQKYKRGGMWYTPVSGIWQTVWLERVPKEYIRSIRITPSEEQISIKIYGGAGTKQVILEDGRTYESAGDEVIIPAEGLEKWTPESPVLYRFTLTAGEDRIESYFAYRWVDVRDIGGVNRICLNGEPYLFNGLLDQGYYPDGIYTPATEEAYRDDILTAKRLGFNMLRKHIKTEPMIFYYLCDTLGMAVFQDMVNNGGYSFIKDTALPTVSTNIWQRLPDRRLSRRKERRMIFEQSMYETADLVYDSPCVVYYTVFNEGWGQFCSDEMYEKLREHDETRIIDTTSGWFRRRKSDVDSRHIYFRPLKPKRPSGRPMVISEFGGYAHPTEGHMYSSKHYGYKTIDAPADYEDAIVRLYENEVRPLVKAGASALVYTQLSDVEDEINGIITYDRASVKLSTKRLHKINEELKMLSNYK